MNISTSDSIHLLCLLSSCIVVLYSQVRRTRTATVSPIYRDNIHMLTHLYSLNYTHPAAATVADFAAYKTPIFRD